MIQPCLPQIDWSAGFARHWNGGSAGRTHLFNALSFLFPQGERFFIDQARMLAEHIGYTDPALKAFIAQEAAHAQQHSRYNEVLERQGYANVSAELALFLERGAYRVFSPLTRLAAVCVYEHYTAAVGGVVVRPAEARGTAAGEVGLHWG